MCGCVGMCVCGCVCVCVCVGVCVCVCVCGWVWVWVCGGGCSVSERQFHICLLHNHTLTANKKLTQMNTELAKAQEHARRFQELLAAERRKQKGLKVCSCILC